MMTIGMFSDRTGLKPKTVRYYEEVGLLVPSIRANNGYRQYDDAQVEMALVIQSLRQAGVPIAGIREFLKSDQSGKEQLLQQWRKETEAKLMSLQITNQFLKGFHPGTRHLRLLQWEEPKRIAWFPLIPEVSTAEQWFDSQNGYISYLANDGWKGIYRSCFVRYQEKAGQFLGEIGYEWPGKGEIHLEGASVEVLPQALFAALECNPLNSGPCNPIFAVIRECGFEPIATPLRHYTADSDERYTLLVPVRFLTE